ncbi:MAG: TIM barrel protein, partial [Euryarchaeota archaeon]|nr:TIM barrel protein [Euryarchaeota archaeon]
MPYASPFAGSKQAYQTCRQYCAYMGRMRLGVMATLDDANLMRSLEMDFIELLVRSEDGIPAVERFIAEEGEMIVHAPERILFQGRRRLLDLSSSDERFRKACVRRISEIAGLAAEYGIPTVIHPGGVLEERRQNNKGLIDSLSRSLDEIEGMKWIENMPLSYHLDDRTLCCNIIMTPEEFGMVRSRLDGFVLDVSHAYLSTVSDGNLAVRRYLEEVGGSIRHLHLSDAIRPDREGVQIGEGEVDFSFLGGLEDIPVLLEVWGGHEEGGVGFAEARRRVLSLL